MTLALLSPYPRSEAELAAQTHAVRLPSSAVPYLFAVESPLLKLPWFPALWALFLFQQALASVAEG